MATARLESANDFLTARAGQTDPVLRVAAGRLPTNAAQLDLTASQALRHAQPPCSRPVTTRAVRKP